MLLLPIEGRYAKKAEAQLAALERRSGAALATVLPNVRKIVSEVRTKGDPALTRYARKFDSLAAEDLIQVTPEESAQAWHSLDGDMRIALEAAAANIRAFAQQQMPQSWRFSPTPGLVTGQLVRPIASAGCYVPGGRHPLPSTMLMTVIPAQVAGVPRIAVASPRPALETLATAHLLGIEEFYRIGGAHAIAALAYGTGSIRSVNKIAGPGNVYVTAAKHIVSCDLESHCSIDMLAGPTEIVVTSEQGQPASIAADLIAQAEHDPQALAIFITANEKLAKQVLAETKKQSKLNAAAQQALKHNGYIFLTGSKQQSQALTNRLAPEHLTVDDESDLTWVENAGSVFIGPYSPQPMGDYISGPNHTLPTGGMAQVRGGLSVMDFVKLISVQQYSPEALAALAPQAIRLAEAEGLAGHAEAIRRRIEAR